METNSKFKKGDKVKYLPYLSGLDNNKPLTVKDVWFETENDLDKMFGISNPTFVYDFEEIPNLCSIEKDLEKFGL